MIFNHKGFAVLSGLENHKRLLGYNGFFDSLPCFVSYPDRDDKFYVSFYVSPTFRENTTNDNRDEQINRQIRRTNDINTDINNILTGSTFENDIISCVYSSFQINAIINLHCAPNKRPQRLYDIMAAIADMIKSLSLLAGCSNCGEPCYSEFTLDKKRSGYECENCRRSTTRLHGKPRYEITARPFRAFLGALLGCIIMIICYLIMWLAGYEGSYISYVGVAAGLGLFMKFGSGFTWKGGIATLALCLVTYLIVCRYSYANDMAVVLSKYVDEERKYVQTYIDEENAFLDELADLNDSQVQDLFGASRNEIMHETIHSFEDFDEYIKEIELYSHTIYCFYDLNNVLVDVTDNTEFYYAYLKETFIGTAIIIVFGYATAKRCKKSDGLPKTKRLY